MNIEGACVEETPATNPTAITATPPAPKPAPQPARPAETRDWSTLLLVLAPVVSAILLWMCYFPLGWGAVLGWFALAPFLLLVRAEIRPRNAYLAAMLCGVLFFFASLQWMRVADWRMYGTWILLTLYCALYFPTTLWLIRFLDRRHVPMAASVALVWIALEWVRSFALTGFAWYYLAHTQHDMLSLIQITDLGGAYAVTLLVAAVNGLAFDIAYQFPEIRRWFKQTELEQCRYYASIEILNRIGAEWHFRRNVIVEGAIVALLLIGACVYGNYRLGQDRFEAGPTVCLLQSNLDQRIRNATRPEHGATIAEHFSHLCVRASKNHHPRPDLIIWPETSYPGEWVEVSDDLPNDKVPAIWRNAEVEMRGRLKQMAADFTQIPHLVGIGANHLDKTGRHRRFNSALLVTADGRVDNKGGKFDKMHRVPFGEFVPFKEWLPFMNALAPYDFDYSIQAGEKFTRFKLNDHHFGVLICYEDTDPFLARRYVQTDADGPPVDFLVNISNDGWFDGTSEHAEHLAISRFRAIECRRAMVRAVNMGVSAVIDSNGRVLKPKLYPDTNPKVWVVGQGDGMRIPDFPPSEWNELVQVAGVVKATVPIDRRFSFYSAAGDWLPIACWALLLGTAAWVFAKRQRETQPAGNAAT